MSVECDSLGCTEGLPSGKWAELRYPSIPLTRSSVLPAVVGFFTFSFPPKLPIEPSEELPPDPAGGGIFLPDHLKSIPRAEMERRYLEH